MTPQEIFNKSLKGIINQGEQCSSNGICVYLHTGDDGVRMQCAAGILFSYEECEKLNNCPSNYISTIANNSEYIFPNWVDNNIDMIREIQRCHDRYTDDHDGEFIDYFWGQMSNVARHFDLLPLPKLDDEFFAVEIDYNRM